MLDIVLFLCPSTLMDSVLNMKIQDVLKLSYFPLSLVIYIRRKQETNPVIIPLTYTDIYFKLEKNMIACRFVYFAAQIAQAV